MIQLLYMLTSLLVVTGSSTVDAASRAATECRITLVGLGLKHVASLSIHCSRIYPWEDIGVVRLKLSELISAPSVVVDSQGVQIDGSCQAEKEMRTMISFCSGNIRIVDSVLSGINDGEHTSVLGIAPGSRMEIHNCTFDSIKGPLAIYAAESTLVVSDSTFANLEHLSSLPKGFRPPSGAGITGVSVKLDLDKTSFTNNTSWGSAGVCISGSSSVATRGCTFSGNRGQAYGVVTVSRLDGSGAWMNNVFVNNTISGERAQGSALQLVEALGELSLVNNTFTDNAADGDHSVGGGVYISKVDGHIRVSRCQFRGNRAAHGGAIGVEQLNGTLTMSTSHWQGNTAELKGGSMWIYLVRGHLRFDEVVVEGGRAGGAGGAVFLQGSANNPAFSAQAEGRLSPPSSDRALVTVNHSLFRNNRADSAGGVNISNVAVVEFTNVTIANNTAQVFGGGVMLQGVMEHIELSDIRVTNNRATNCGGGLDVSDFFGPGQVVIRQALVVGNQAGYGAGLMMFNVNNSLVSDSLIANNTADYVGGGVDYWVCRGQQTLRGVTVVGNAARYVGGGVLFQAEEYNEHMMARLGAPVGFEGVEPGEYMGSLTVTHSKIVNNTAMDGGGLAVNMPGGTLDMRGVTISGNKALRDFGGATFIEVRSNVSMHDLVLEANMAGHRGGGMGFTGLQGGSLQMQNVTFHRNQGEQGGGLALYDVSSPMALQDVSFIRNLARGDGGGLLVKKCLGSVHIRESEFIGNRASGQGGGVALSGLEQAVMLQDVRWSSNVAESGAGGGLSCSHVLGGTVEVVGGRVHSNQAPVGAGLSFDHICGNTRLHNVMMEGNVASGAGGALALKDLASLHMKKLRVTGNSARLGGGVYMRMSGCREGSQLEVAYDQDMVITQNTAMIGGGIMVAQAGVRSLAPPFPLGIAFNNTARRLSADWFWQPSGVRVERGNGSVIASRSGPEEGLLELVAQVDSPVAGVRLVVEAADPLERVMILKGDSEVTDEQGRAIFRSLKVTGSPGAYQLKVKRMMSEEEMQVYGSYPEVGQVHQVEQSITIHIRGCAPGEITPEGTSNCDPCPPGWYSFTPGDRKCQPCPRGAICSGGASLVPLPGYWHAGPLVPFIEVCPNKAACQGDREALGLQWRAMQEGSSGNVSWTESLAMQCSEGYHGPLCGRCVRKSDNKDKYGSMLAFTCQKCAKAALVGVLLALGLLVLAGIILLTILTTMRDNAQLISATNLRATDIWKVLVMYLQNLYILNTLLVNPPDVLQKLMQGLTYIVAGSQVMSLDCLLPVLSGRGPHIPLGIQKWLIHVATPMLVVLMLSAVWLLVWWIRPIKQLGLRRYLADRMLLTALVSMHFFYPLLVRLALTMFDCVRVQGMEPASGKKVVVSYWSSDLSLQCWATWHRQLALPLGVILSIILCLVFPLGVVGFLHKRRHDLADDQFKQRYGFLYRNYHRHRCYWEGIMYLQITALVAFSILGRSLGTSGQLQVYMALVSVLVAINVMVQPYRFSRLFMAQVVGWLFLLCTANGMLTFANTGNDAGGVQQYRDAVGVVLVVMNSVYVVSMLGWAAWLFREGVTGSRKAGLRAPGGVLSHSSSSLGPRAALPTKVYHHVHGLECKQALASFSQAMPQNQV